MSHLLWIAVPGGRTANGDGVLRAVMIPVLDTGGSLAQEGMATWPPERLTGADARLTVEAATDVGATPAVTVQHRPAVDAVAGLWTRFFGSIDVTPPGPAGERGVEVDPTTERAEQILSTYREAARELTGEDERPAFDASVRTRLAAFRGAVAAPIPQPGSGTPSGRPVDFHLATAILREHPAVLRALGLIVELTVPAADLQRMPEAGVLRVTWPSAPAGVPQGQPRWTSYQRERFLPAPRPSSDLHPAGGMVALAREVAGRPAWRLHTVDVDHALRGLAHAMSEAADGAALPALRTAGVLLARAGRSEDLDRRGRRNGARNSPTAPLFAEDLVLGYRIDAKVLGQSWHSLCRRESRYAVNGVEFAAGLKEEGHVKVGGGIDRGDRVVRTDEVVARWDGWSMAVSRPALRERPARAPNPSLPFHLDTSGLRAEPGTLLRLRFGQTYQLRARVADIAGGGPLLAEPSLDGCDSEPVRFTRHEPVPPPDVRLPAGLGAQPFGPGGSLTTLVIRSADGVADTVGDTTRDLVPPSATFELLERHGRLDGDPDATRELLARVGLPDPAAGGVVGFIRGDPGEPPRDLETKDWTSSRPGPPAPDPWPDLATKRIVLRARSGSQPTLNWDTDELLVIRLSPAEEATVEISSLIDQDARIGFSISDWLKEGPGDGAPGGTSAAEDLLASGRHPMATPARRITVRHAVRKPRGTPQGTLAVDRAEGASFATMRPADGAEPLLGVHPASTAAVDVAASWKPVEDLDDPEVVRRPVGRIPIGRSDAAVAPVRHELGDTKHRMVTYTWTALSRYRGCFDPGPDGDFQTEGTLGPVSVPSSARPVPPVVRSATPAFLWQEERPPGQIVRRRLGNRVRVELAPPWFTTGDGERLAVVVAAGTPGPGVAALLTQAGRDPVWHTESPPRFPVPAGQALPVTLVEGGAAQIVAHGVFQAAGSWFADVVFPATPSYSALVQLAVARFQPESLPGLALSPVVRTDFVPLLPERTLTVDLSQPGAMAVTLRGPAPIGPRPNRVDVVVEHRVEVFEVLEGVPLTVGEDGTWEVLSSASGPVGTTLQLSNPGFGPLRVRVREVESIGADHSPRFGTVGELEERVVFTDTVPI